MVLNEEILSLKEIENLLIEVAELGGLEAKEVFNNSSLINSIIIVINMLLAKQENCADTEIITAGTKLIYYLRQFLTQERMVFSYASSYTDEKKE